MKRIPDTCVSKARLGGFMTNRSAEERKAVDKAISLSLDINMALYIFLHKYDIFF